MAHIRQGGKGMKKLSLLFLGMVFLASGAAAHEGSLGLFTSTAANDCDATIPLYTEFDIFLMYYSSDAGPDAITAVEFKIELADNTLLSRTEWNPGITYTVGNIQTGIGASLSGCTGTTDGYLWIATIVIFATAPQTTPFKVLTSEEITSPPYTPRVSLCDTQHSLHGVLGGWFLTTDGTCNVATKESTWGTIKSMYK
jgi:hypothetical protein